MIALINARIYDYHHYIENGYVIFNQKIIDVGSMDQYQENPAYQQIDCQNKLIIPGLVTGHTHLYSTFARGASLSFNPKNFLDILKQMWWKIDHFLDEDMIYYSALMGGLDQLKHGTTTLIDHHASHLVKGSLSLIHKALVETLGLRAVLAFETSDRFNISDAIKENINYIDHPKKDSAGMFGMHASLSLSDDSLEKIKEVLGQRGIHIHVAESQMDEDKCLETYGKRVVQRLDDYGLINENSLLVHCTHINEEEMDIIKKRRATIAINPTSNLNNAVGISHVKAFMDKGIRVILGNDGLMQSQMFDYLNTYYLGHLKNQSPTAFTLDHIKQIMINTYEFASEMLKVDSGHIRKGSEADLLVLPYKPYTKMDELNAFGHMFFGVFPGFLPEKIFVKGKAIIDGYQLCQEDDDWFKQAQKQSEKLWKILEKEGDYIEFTD
jgi:cytosine/adenosine deaminase-related metal-dependent hydrolase